MPHQTEPNANNALGNLLQGMLPGSQVRSENTQAFTGRPGLKPDILITAPGRAPVVVEAEYMPAAGDIILLRRMAGGPLGCQTNSSSMMQIAL